MTALTDPSSCTVSSDDLVHNIEYRRLYRYFIWVVLFSVKYKPGSSFKVSRCCYHGSNDGYLLVQPCRKPKFCHFVIWFQKQFEWPTVNTESSTKAISPPTGVNQRRKEKVAIKMWAWLKSGSQLTWVFGSSSSNHCSCLVPLQHPNMESPGFKNGPETQDGAEIHL